MSTIEQNKAVIRRIFEAINSGDWDKFRHTLTDVVTPDYRIHNPAYEKSPISMAEWWNIVENFMKDHLNFKVTFYEVIGEGDMTATRNIAEWMDANTKEMFQTELIFLSRFENGKIAEEWELVYYKPMKKAG